MPVGPCWADCSNFLHVGWHPRRNHAYQILSRSSRGLLSYGGPKLGFSYAFLNGSYNSVTHWRATLWCRVTYVPTFLSECASWHIVAVTAPSSLPSASSLSLQSFAQSALLRLTLFRYHFQNHYWPLVVNIYTNVMSGVTWRHRSRHIYDLSDDVLYQWDRTNIYFIQ